MRLLVITVAYPPEIRSASHLMHEFVEELKKRGHEITVITTFPQDDLMKKGLNKNYKTLSDEEGVEVIRVKTLPLYKINYLIRGVIQLVLPLIFYQAARKFISKKPDAIIVYSPPLTLGLAAVWLSKRYSAKTILNIHDIFPQNAIDLGILKNKLLIKFFEYIEKWLYKKVDLVTVHSPGNKQFLIENKQLPPEKIEVVHNWVDYDFFSNAVRGYKFRKKYDIDSKLVILFAGILGPAQGLDVIIDIAKKIEKKSMAHFLFVGDGTEKKKLEDIAINFKLSNVSFYPFVSKEEYSSLLKDVDVGLVALNADNKTPVVPGKLLGYMASELPVLAVLNKESDCHQIIKQSECGFSFQAQNQEEIINAILKLEKDEGLRKNMGKKGAVFVRENFSQEGAVDQYEEIFELIKNE